MFTGAEMTRGNMTVADRNQVMATLRIFSEIMRMKGVAKGLGANHNPFARPANFLAALHGQSLHLVVDETSIGGMPDHTYIDKRADAASHSLQEFLGAAIQDLAFRAPLGVTLPTAILSADEASQRQQLEPIADNGCAELAKRAVVARLQLPQGYQHFVRFMPAFLADHPDPECNVFLMMRFRPGPQYQEIHVSIRDELAQYGLKVLRADDKDYTGDLWENVALHMLGSRYGVAVFEEIDQREFNPNVALELGFMMALNKRCLLLKDQRMPRMPTDVVGKLYREFDTYKISDTINASIRRWATDLGLTARS